MLVTESLETKSTTEEEEKEEKEDDDDKLEEMEDGLDYSLRLVYVCSWRFGVWFCQLLCV